MAGQSDDYEVGYGKPPPAHRFQKGKSGNPGGRPRGDKTLAFELGKVLDQKVPGHSNGKRQRKSVRRIIATSLAKKGAEGNLQAVALINKIESRQVPHGASSAPTQKSTQEPDPDIGNRFEVRLQLEEGPVRPPDFTDCMEVELVRPDLPDDIRAKIEQLKSCKEYLIANQHRLGRDLSEFME